MTNLRELYTVWQFSDCMQLWAGINLSIFHFAWAGSVLLLLLPMQIDLRELHTIWLFLDCMQAS